MASAGRHYNVEPYCILRRILIAPKNWKFPDFEVSETQEGWKLHAIAFFRITDSDHAASDDNSSDHEIQIHAFPVIACDNNWIWNYESMVRLVQMYGVYVCYELGGCVRRPPQELD